MSRKHAAAAPHSTKGPDSAGPALGRTMLVGLAILSAGAIGFGVYNSQPALNASARSVEPAQVQSRSGPALASFQPVYGFGSISMAAGKVRHTYTISNTGGEPLQIVGVTTSCMCTEATVVTNNGRFGPFGMAGHGRMPSIRETVAPGAIAQVEVVFDPAAHGPAGVGRTERTIRIETDAGTPLQLALTAMVRP